MEGIDALCEHLLSHEDWLMGRVLFYAKRQGYTQYTPPLEEAWRAPIRGCSQAITEALRREGGPVELSPDTDFPADPVAAFGILEAQRHRGRGVTLALFLGLMKYFRQAYLDLVVESDLPGLAKDQCLLSLNRLYDRMELGCCAEWAARDSTHLLEELQRVNRLLTNEKNKYLTLFASGPTPALLLDPDNHIAAINHAAAGLLFGEETPGESYYGDLDLSQTLPWLPAGSMDATAGGPGEGAFGVSLQTRQGDRCFEVQRAALLDYGGKSSGTVLTFSDVTDTRRDEAEIRRLNRLLGMLSDVNEMVVRTTDRQQVMDEVCRICVERGGFWAVAIRLIDSDGPGLKVAAHHGRGRGYLEWATATSDDSPYGRGPCGLVVRTGERWVTEDVATAPEMALWREEALRHGLKSIGAFPLRVGGEVVGALAFYSDSVGFADEDEVRLLDEMADDVSLALESIEREDRRRQLEAQRELTSGILTILNEPRDRAGAIREIVTAIRDFSGMEAVGLRLREGEDFPYYQTNGFPESFVLLENSLCSRDAAGELRRDACGDCLLECMCGNVVQGRTDATYPFFTDGGSFWSNGTSALLAATTPEERQANTRNRCNGWGYESVALVPLRSGGETIGLLQLNDKRPDRLTPDLVRFLEELGNSIGIALARARAEDQRRAILQTAMDGFWLADREGRLLDVNEAYCRMSGYSRDELLSLSIHDLEVFEVGDDVAAHMQQLTVTADERFEARHRRKDGSVFDVELGVQYRPDDGGGFVVFLRDITARKQTESQREFTTRVLRVLAEPGESLNAVRKITMAVKDFTGMEAVGLRLREGEDFPYYETNGFAESFVLVENSLVERGPEGGICRDEDGNVSLECTCGLVLSGGTPQPHPLFTPGGSFWTNNSFPLLDLPPDEDPRHRPRNECIHRGYASVALIPLRSGGETIGLLQLNDKRPDRLTLDLVQFLEGLGSTIGIALARQRGEEALRESEELFRRIVQDQTEMICRSLPDGTITFVNDAYCRFFGVAREDLIGSSIYAIMPEQTRIEVAGAVGRLTPSQPTVTMELPFSFPDGRKGWTQWTHRVLFTPAGQALASQATGADVSALKKAEAESRLASVGQLAAGVAHDFNNLLLAMGGTAQMVEIGRCEPAKLVDIVRKSARSGAEITRDLMAFARPEEPRREPGHLEQSLGAALAVANRQLANAEVEVVRQYATAARTVVFDPTQMAQVFLNLIINASHAMPGGGTLTVGTEYPSTGPGAGQAVIRITDTGTGIAPEHLDHIFEPFFTTKGRLCESETPGSGLGLSVSYGLVTAHGGTIGVSSVLGVGTTFEICLPVSQDATAVAEPADEGTITAAAMAALKGARVLLAEDDAEVLALLRQLFDAAGTELVTAAAASEAIEALRQERFDLVLSDLMMPGGGGRAVLEFCRTVGDDAPPVVIMTGRLERALHDEVIAMGAARSIEKPFDLGELLRVLGEVLGVRG